LSDRIYLDNLRAQSRVGVSSRERSKPQEVILSVSLFLELAEASRSDSLSATVDYRKLRAAVSEVAARGEFRLLEGLAGKVASALLEKFPVDRVVVDVRKSKYASSPAIGVQLERMSGSNG
jgi:dihydroneopterin aldolase